MSKRKRKRAEQAPRPEDHSPEQVKEVALMLYVRRFAQDPFPPKGIILKFALNQLVRRANDLLDKLDVACEEVAKQRKADAQKPPPDVVPFNKAVMDITGEKHKHLDRALERFEALPHISAQVARMCWLVNWREQIALWRKNGMKRNEVEWLRSLYDEKAYRRWRIAAAGKAPGRAKKRRAPWSKKRLDKVQSETHAREAKKEAKKEKVNALPKTARTGEIE